MIKCCGFLALAVTTAACCQPISMEKQLTFGPRHHDIDNNDNFTLAGDALVIDTREDESGIAGNAVIARVELATGAYQELYREPSPHAWGPGVGAVNVNPKDGSIAFIRGLSDASAELPYAMWRRSGALVGPDGAGPLRFLDGRDVHPPFTAGALRGGTHRHEWSGDGDWIGFTYNDALLADIETRTGEKVNLRTVGVARRRSGPPIAVPTAPGNHAGEFFAVVAVTVVPHPRPGSDEIDRAFEDAWVGTAGYLQQDGTWQKHARAFLGNLRTPQGQELTEVFIVDLPERLDVPGAGPLQGTPTTMPSPPRGARQRRLTFTENRRFPGVALLPRHWVRSSPDGTRILFLARDDAGVVQAFLVSPQGGTPQQVTTEVKGIESTVRWSPDGASLLYVADGAVKVCGAEPKSPAFGQSRALTRATEKIPESPVWSPDGRWIAFNRRVLTEGVWRKQIFLVQP